MRLPLDLWEKYTFVIDNKIYAGQTQEHFHIFYLYGKYTGSSANTLTKDPDNRIIRISEPEYSDPYYPDIRIIRIIRISELSGYSY